MANHFSILALRTPWTVWKGKKDRTLKDELPRFVGAQYANGNQRRTNSRKNEEMEPCRNNTGLLIWLVMEVKSDAVKRNIVQEPGMLGPWIEINWKWSNRRWQRVNIIILGISELKWTRMGEVNSDDHYIYNCEQESLPRHGVTIIVNKRVQNTVLGCNLKNNRMISVRFQGK